MRGKTNRQAPRAEIPHRFFYPVITVYIHGVDGKLHEKHVDALAWHNPEPTSGFQIPVLQQTHPAGSTAVGNIDSITERRTPGQVPYIEFQVPFYSTQKTKMERNL